MVDSAALRDASRTADFFEPYAAENRLALRSPLACSRSRPERASATRRLASVLPEVFPSSRRIDQRCWTWPPRSGPSCPVEWRQADAMRPPFPDGRSTPSCASSGDVVPDKAKAFSEARRVLLRGASFSSTYGIGSRRTNSPPRVTQAFEATFPRSPPRFLARAPHGYHYIPLSNAILRTAALPRRRESPGSRTQRAHRPRSRDRVLPGHATRSARDASPVGEATDVAAKAIAQRFGARMVTERYKPTSSPSRTRRSFARGPRRGPRPLEVKLAERAGDVDDLADEDTDPARHAPPSSSCESARSVSTPPSVTSALL